MRDLSLFGLAYVLAATVLTFDVLLTKKRPVSAVLWLGILWIVPLAGALAYLSFGVDRVRRGGAVRSASNRLLAQRAKLHPRLEHLIIDPSRWRGDREHAAAHVFAATDPATRLNSVFTGNRVQLLVDGDELFPDLFSAIAQAQSSVHIQTFIIARDHTGQELLDLLIDRARAGLNVRLLYDRFGSTWAHLTRFFTEAKAHGVRVHSITQANVFKGRFQLNLRNHRKIAVIDGRVGYIGGINVHDQNRSAFTNGRPIRDYHVRVEGPAVSDLQLQFVRDWFFASHETPERLMDHTHFPALDPVGEALVQVVPGGPEHDGEALSDAFFGAIVSARRSLTIVTPYFVPDEPIVQAIRHTALRGVEVRLVVPRVSNHRYAEFAARTLYGPLLKTGVRIFERRPPFIHAKALLVDDVYAMLGSANFDYRSLQLNFETNLEVADSAFVARVAEQVAEEIRQCEEITLDAHRRRPFPRRLLERFCHLFQPIL